MKILQNINYSVIDAAQKKNAEIIKVNEGNLSGSVPTSYVIKLNITGLDSKPYQFIIQRRYNDFYKTLLQMKKKHPHLVFPSIPEKNMFKDVEERRKNLEMFVNKILTIKNWEEFPELRNFFSDQKKLEFQEEGMVGSVKDGIKKLSGFFGSYFKQKPGLLPEILNSNQNVEMDESMNSLKLNFDDSVSNLQKLIQTLKSIHAICVRNTESFSGLYTDFNEFKENSNMLLHKNSLKKTFDIQAKQLKANSVTFDQTNSKLKHLEFLFSNLLMDLSEVNKATEKYMLSREEFKKQYALELESNIDSNILADQE